jgi:hypothetical protein
MSYSRETKQAAQDAYHEARAFGHTKEEARQIRDNWKSPKTSSSCNCDDEYISYTPWEPYDRDCIDD